MSQASNTPFFYKQSIFDPRPEKRVLACSLSGLFNFCVLFAPANYLEIVQQIRIFGAIV